jgi:hypothetical protein
MGQRARELAAPFAWEHVADAYAEVLA